MSKWNKRKNEIKVKFSMISEQTNQNISLNGRWAVDCLFWSYVGTYKMFFVNFGYKIKRDTSYNLS